MKKTRSKKSRDTVPLKESIPKKSIGELQTGFHFTDTDLRKKRLFRIRIRIHMFLGPPDPDPDPLVRCMDPDQDPASELDPDRSIIKKK
jgi:hypothetical protein